MVRLRLAVIFSLIALTGCQSAGYFSQAISGQVEILSRANSIKSLLSAPDGNQELKAKLKKIQVIRDFAVKELGLLHNQSFLEYSDLGREFVVWNVFVVPQLSVDPINWCFPFAGCVSYRGYFQEDKANKFAQYNKSLGRDTIVLGVPAYSTLGWFADPVLNTFLHYSDLQLVSLIFHELAHQIVYVQDDTTFNESFAVSVEIEGVNRWLSKYGLPADKEAWIKGRIRHKDFLSLFSRTREKLSQLYTSSLDDNEKFLEKEKIIVNLKSDYNTLKKKWMGFEGFDFFVSGSVNNATFVPLLTYWEYVPFFNKLLNTERSFQSFLEKTKVLAKMSKQDRETMMKSLISE